ncbi:MAG: alpha/beta hydrolase [Aliiglaciecola sp.]|uniref:alpha/beta hydrolase n=1 Tax=Aliiglaciecola sp. TaxID=1872441 RepID=UPI0032980FED
MTHVREYDNGAKDKTFSLNAFQKMQRLALKFCCTALPPIGLKVALYHFTNTRKRRPYNLIDLPPQLQSRKIAYRNGHIVAHSWGHGDKVVYLVHGWESNSNLMKAFISPLLKQGYKVVAFDMPAHGLSSNQATHLGDFSATLQFVISIYGKPFGIVAHSFGGTASVLLLCKHKHLLPTKLCLISPMKSLDSHLQVFNTITGLPEAIMDKLLKRLKKQYALEAKKTDITRLIQSVPVSGLLIHDEDDRLIPIEVGDQLADAWHGAQYIKTRTLGHRNILKDAFVIQQVTDYMLDHRKN